MDQVWREVKGLFSAHDQYSAIDVQAASAEHWSMALTPAEALRHVARLSPNFWLKSSIK